MVYGLLVLEGDVALGELTVVEWLVVNCGELLRDGLVLLVYVRALHVALSCGACRRLIIIHLNPARHHRSRTISMYQSAPLQIALLT